MTHQARPYTGAEYLDSLRDGREIWIYGERVKDVTAHPAFRNPARMLARLYDALHDPVQNIAVPTDTGNGGITHPFFKVSRTREELIQAREAIVAWARLTYGWMGRSPDYKASFMVTLGFNPDYYAPYQDNARRWYAMNQERCPFLNHAIVNPPIDRQRPPEEVADVYVHCEQETDAGIIVSGAKVVATGSALTHYNFLGQYGPTPTNDPRYAISGMVKMDAPGVKLICRPSYAYQAEVMGSPFDYPLSSRLDENDAILVLDKVLIPWEDLFIYGDCDKAAQFLPASGWANRFAFHGCTRLAVKFDFITGLLMKAVELTGSRDFRGVQVAIGEALAWRHLFWSLSDAMCGMPEDGPNGAIQPNVQGALAYRVIATMAYPRLKELVENAVASGLIYLNSHAVDFKVPELRGYIDKYIRGSYGHDAEDRVKTMRLLWDAIGTEFGSRHELYERNYAGNHENIRLENLWIGQARGLDKELMAFAERCMGEYDLDGWTVGDLINPTDVNLFMGKGAMSVPAAPALQPEQLRTLSGFFATGVTVVLADHAGQQWGMTVNSFTSLSLDPPLVLFCAQTGSSVLRAIEASQVFTVNVLAIEQAEISSQLARRGGPEKMRGIDTVRVFGGAARLAGALAWFGCSLERCEPAGDHLIVIGRVLDGGHREPGGEPLLFYRSAYRALRALD